MCNLTPNMAGSCLTRWSGILTNQVFILLQKWNLFQGFVTIQLVRSAWRVTNFGRIDKGNQLTRAKCKSKLSIKEFKLQISKPNRFFLNQAVIWCIKFQRRVCPFRNSVPWGKIEKICPTSLKYLCQNTNWLKKWWWVIWEVMGIKRKLNRHSIWQKIPSRQVISTSIICSDPPSTKGS